MLFTTLGSMRYGYTRIVNANLSNIIRVPNDLHFTTPMENMEEVIAHLFPTHANVIFDCDSGDTFSNFTIDELHRACKKINNKSPGPGIIPPEIITIFQWFGYKFPKKLKSKA